MTDLITALRARVAELEAALTLIADEQNVYKGYGDYDTVPRYTAEEAQMLARRVLSGIKEGDT